MYGATLQTSVLSRGIPDSQGQLPPDVVEANLIIEHVMKILTAGAARGLPIVLESPPNRSLASPWHIEGRDDHADLFTYPAVRVYMRRFGDYMITFDQCMVYQFAQKKTVLLCTWPIFPVVAKHFAALRCPPYHVGCRRASIQASRPRRFRRL